MDLESFRKGRGLSQVELAKALGLRSKSYISDIERGRQQCSVRLALKIQTFSDGEVLAHTLRPDIVLPATAGEP